MREIQDLFDIFPYCLLVALPIMIILSPTADAVGHEFPAHRLAQFELGGVARGPKAAALSMDARSAPSEANVNLLRKTIITKIQDISVTAFNDLVSSGAGGVLLLIPNQDQVQKLSEQVRESINALQDHLYTTEFEIPVYFAEETPELNELLDSLGGEAEKKPSAYEMLLQSVANYGYQLVSSNSAVPKAISHPEMISIEAVLRGSTNEDEGNDVQPTLVVVAHHDSKNLAPSLPSGADGSGSSVAVLLELARVFGKLYASSRSRPPMGMVFLLSSGGSMNYFGTKKWLESHMDQDELLNDVPFVTCLNSLYGNGNALKMHVSKPPKSDSHAGKFLANLGPKVEIVHKKINLADELLAWEHERFSIRRLPALTLSALKSHEDSDRNDLLFDNYVDPEDLYQKVKQIGEALACTAYNYAEEGCSGNVLTGSLAPSKEFLTSWLDLVSDSPRFPSMISGKNDPYVQALLAAMKSSVGADNVRAVNAKRDAREPEFVLYDGTQTTITAYKVKPAVFDLVLTLCIGAYLGLVYLAIMKSGWIVSLVSNLTNANASSKMNGTVLNNNGSPNGHVKSH